jgi:hypothetical protein
MNKLLVLVLAVFASGCIRNPIAMMPSTKPLAPGSFTEIGPVEETDCLWYLFSVIPITTGNNMQGAMRDAISKSGGDALVQVTAETYYQNFILLSRYCTIIQGVAVRSTPQPLPR